MSNEYIFNIPHAEAVPKHPEVNCTGSFHLRCQESTSYCDICLYRLSSFVYRLSSIVFRLSFKTPPSH